MPEKTTLLALLEGFYGPDAGRILLNGVDIREMPLDALRAQSGYVEQDAPVLDGTVRENLLLGRPAASEADLARAIDEAGCEAVLNALPYGLDTEVGEAGVLLSGGQRQRIAIARALVSNPPLLLLDEPTSQLDALTEADLRATLEHLRGQRTIIVVAHRLATVLAADRIVVLKDGTTQATGNHRLLLEHDATYRTRSRRSRRAADLRTAPRGALSRWDRGLTSAKQQPLGAPRWAVRSGRPGGLP